MAGIKDVLLSFADLVTLFRLEKMKPEGFRAFCATDKTGLGDCFHVRAIKITKSFLFIAYFFFLADFRRLTAEFRRL
jgi:hypothetical protein